ncbi:hypothetical protein B9T26_10725 [Acinetobacter sp. ANC 4169]|uniref:hypothetical protein n=1 Tax=Acinetobacter sp. ANC 4169 TaxID=1977879 RepID=UPI000A357908|nr:hypothetical protein [Acinetobacter sp. ANC 4169]OTG72393.1 hypothetical protein B9T26_10725 [Acinetobacter sp. ANC 4169]
MDQNQMDQSKYLEQINDLFRVIKSGLESYLQSIQDINDPQIKNLVNENNFKIVMAFSFSKFPEYFELVNDNAELFANEDLSIILINALHALKVSVLNIDAQSPYALAKLNDSIDFFISTFATIKVSLIALNNTNRIMKYDLDPKIKEVEEKIKDLESVRLALEMRETDQIYLDLYNKYNDEYRLNNLYFTSVFGLSVFFTIFSILFFANFKPIDWIIFISIKVLILAVGITLCTLFLRRSSHAKKLKEQAYQTHVEINAFPIHVRSLKDEDKHELIKELALKYFGKELDHTQNDKIGDLMKDQLTAGTELIKASAEMVKAKGSSTPSP